MRPEKCIEFSVALTNQPGAFAELSKKLTASGVQVKVFMLYTSYVMAIPDTPLVAGMCKMVVDNEDIARETLKGMGAQFREEVALLLRTKKQTNVLPLILERLAEAELNLIDAYGTLPLDGEGLVLVLSVSDEERGLEVASQLDWSVS